MSTAVDTAFEELASAYDETAKPVHGICGVCYPLGAPVPPGTSANCGWVVPAEGATLITSAAGKHRCDDCLNVYYWPCGHHR